MTEKITYIADDGTEFEFEDDCQEYEWFKTVHPCLENIQMWDEEENLMPMPGNYIDMQDALENMHYIRGIDLLGFWEAISDTDLECNLFDYRSFRDEAYNADDGDLLMFDTEMDCWVNVNQRFEELREILKMFGIRG